LFALPDVCVDFLIAVAFADAGADVAVYHLTVRLYLPRTRFLALLYGFLRLLRMPHLPATHAPSPVRGFAGGRYHPHLAWRLRLGLPYTSLPHRLRTRYAHTVVRFRCRLNAGLPLRRRLPVPQRHTCHGWRLPCYRLLLVLRVPAVRYAPCREHSAVTRFGTEHRIFYLNDLCWDGGRFSMRFDVLSTASRGTLH